MFWGNEDVVIKQAKPPNKINNMTAKSKKRKNIQANDTKEVFIFLKFCQVIYMVYNDVKGTSEKFLKMKLQEFQTHSKSFQTSPVKN